MSCKNRQHSIEDIDIAINRLPVATSYVLLGVSIAVADGWSVLIAFAVLFAGLLGWFSRLTPTNEAEWQPDVATLAIWVNNLVNQEHLPLSWKILVSGYVPQYLYEQGRLDVRVPFFELRERAHVNERAQAADAAADFSQRIREATPAAASNTSGLPPIAGDR